MAETQQNDDYMADISLFLPPENPPSSKKKLTSKTNESPSAPRPKRPKTLSWQEHRKLENERKQQEEDRQTKARLDTSIPESNLGFRMLRQMGYEPGTALGKDGCGAVKPVGLEIRRSRAGIGSEGIAEEKLRKGREEEERIRVGEEDLAAEFGCRQRMQWRGKRVERDWRKAEAVVAQLENKEVLEEKKEGEEEEEEEEEEEVVITVEVFFFFWFDCFVFL